MKILVIVPVFNEEKMVLSVVRDLQKNHYSNILIIDDGSSDNSLNLIKKLKVNYLSHIMNRGLGAALATGLQFARINNYDVVVTFDSDGQHRAGDLRRLLAPIISGSADVAIGSRMTYFKKDMPLDRLIINFAANIITYILYGFYSSDSQSGLRAFNRVALNVINIKTDRMEVSSEILNEIKRNGLRFCEVPVEPIYTTYSRQSGQSNLNAFSVGFKLFLRLFR